MVDCEIERAGSRASRAPYFLLPFVAPVSGVYADLVTVAGFKPVVASEKSPGGFDSLPLPLSSCLLPLQMTRNPAKARQLTHFLLSVDQMRLSWISRHFALVRLVVT